MKILQIINNLDTGGAEKLLLDTIPLFVKKGIKMDLLVFEDLSGVCLDQLISLNCCNIYHLGSRSLYSPFNIFKIIPFLHKYDLVHVHLFPAQYWAVFAKLISFSKCKLIFTEHSTSNRRRENVFFKHIDKFVYNCYQKIICITDEVKQELINYSNLKNDKFLTIENGIDLDCYAKATPKLKSEIHSTLIESDKLLIQVAKFRKAKDQVTVIKAMSDLPNDVKLILVGDGELKFECEDLVNKLSLNNRVFFLGTRTDVASLLKTADISILSSHWEGFGLAAVEGMAVGKPVIVSNVPGLSKVVGKAGVLFEKENVQELVQKIKYILYNEEIYRGISINCKKHAMIYDINVMIERTLEVYGHELNGTI
jgi:glycosyltransferase involved in cell wall biosynthesis